MRNKLWFNIEGDEMEEEVIPDMPQGDSLDKFDPEGGFVYNHPFGFDDLPEEVQWNEEVEHCEFLKTERENITTEMNFATTQEEIDELGEKLELLSELSETEDCI